MQRARARQPTRWQRRRRSGSNSKSCMPERRPRSTTFDALIERKAGALLILADAFYGGHVTQLVGLAAHHRLPTMYYRREYTVAGGLVSYGTNINDAYRQAGLY